MASDTLRKIILSFLRKAGFAGVLDQLRFRMMRRRHQPSNSAFKKNHPDVVLPSDYMMYESFLMNYDKYYHGGREDAQHILKLFSQQRVLHSEHILDWGCGPARILRHLPSLLGNTHRFEGCDYNPETIAWCKANLPGIEFSQNQLTPPLPYPTARFTLLYGISIFTHLSETMHTAWADELYRVMRQEGLVLLTTHGDAFCEKLTKKEKAVFSQNLPVIRAGGKEGHRTYAAFQPPGWMQQIFEASGFIVTQHIPGKRVHAEYIAQDTWLLRKP